MAIYGVALLAICYLFGLYIGDVLGPLLGVKANVGGVGFAMLFLILSSTWLVKKGSMDKKTESGLNYWSAMYIPIVVAMVMSQDVVAALSGGPLAFAGGILAVLLGFFMIPVLSKL